MLLQVCQNYIFTSINVLRHSLLRGWLLHQRVGRRVPAVRSRHLQERQRLLRHLVYAVSGQRAQDWQLRVDVSG